MVPDINGDFVQWLRGFYYTVEAGSLIAATSIMHRNQSAITYQIQSLESIYGVHLFTNIKGGKRGLTEEGKFLYAKAIELFAEIDSIRSAIGQLHEDTAGEIKIAASNSLLEYFLAESVRTFMDRYPRTSFILEGVIETRPALRMLTSRQVDFCVVSLDGIPDSFAVTEIFTSDILLLSPKNGPYAFTTPDPERLSEVPYIAPPPGSALEVHLRGQFFYHGLEMRKEILSSYAGGVKAFVSQGLGVSFMNDFSLCEADYENFSIVPMQSLFKPMKYGIVRRRIGATIFLCEEFIRHFQSSVAPNSDRNTHSGAGYDS